MNISSEIQALCKRARTAGHDLARHDGPTINRALGYMADYLQAQKGDIQAANARDLDAAQAEGLTGAKLQRLNLDDRVFGQMVEGIHQVIELPYPVGEVLREWSRPNGLHLRKMRVPIGVIGIIYESRPNVTVDASVLCLKTNNTVVLRGGSEAFHSNQALCEALRAGAVKAGLPEDAVQLLPTTDRAAITALCHQDKYLDLIIPRGGEGLIRTVTAEARMPVLKHFDGICHVYLHREADPAMAESIVLNAKCQKPGVCNAAETLLVDRDAAPELLPRLAKALAAAGVELRGDAEAVSLLERAGLEASPASEDDWKAEYLDLILAVKIVGDVEEAIAHIHRYGSAHTDVIVTANIAVAEEFLQRVDSAAVMWNASSRFHDGFAFGFGAEIGISTDKLHARGPMGLEELTSYKYLVSGQGQVRE
ncbi:MAG: glutamate-5-semialdehyde dehydrogenase [Verrucomicrobiota bacterium]